MVARYMDERDVLIAIRSKCAQSPQMWCASERQRQHGRRGMTIRICGELDVLDPIFPGSMACAPMTGTLLTSLIRARLCPTRSCLLTHGCSTDRPPHLTGMLRTWSPICGL